VSPYRFDHKCQHCKKRRPVRIVGNLSVCAKCAKALTREKGSTV
jgi:ribosomal protein L37AE/L43A